MIWDGGGGGGTGIPTSSGMLSTCSYSEIERVYPPLYKVTDTPFHIKVDINELCITFNMCLFIILFVTY